MGDNKVPDALEDLAASILNNATTPTGEVGDGVALYSTRGPVEVTEAMLDAGHAKLDAVIPRELLREVFQAMEAAAPILPDPEISDDAITTATVEYYLDEPTVEAFAIRLALGNNGGHWLRTADGKEHYTDEQKEHWRQVVRDLAREVRHAHKMRFIEDDCR